MRNHQFSSALYFYSNCLARPAEAQSIDSINLSINLLGMSKNVKLDPVLYWHWKPLTFHVAMKFIRAAREQIAHITMFSCLITSIANDYHPLLSHEGKTKPEYGKNRNLLSLAY